MKKMISLLVFLSFACHQESKNPKLKIAEKVAQPEKSATDFRNLVGLWKFVSNTERKPYAPKFNLEILSDTLCDLSTGFYKEIESYKNERDAQLYLGTRTKYQIVGDSLKIYDPGNFKWFAYKLHRLTRDTLELKGYEQSTITLKRHQRKIVDSLDYDAIIVSRGSCFGSCPINNTYIDRKGNFIFQPHAFNTSFHLRYAKLPVEKFLAFEAKFKQYKIKTLGEEMDNDYNFTCGSTTTVTFIKNSRIYATVSDYAMGGLPEIVQAYTELSYYYQKIQLEYNHENPLDDDMAYLNLKSPRQSYYLGDSKGFFLMAELMKAKKSNAQFKPTHVLDFMNTDNEDGERSEWDIQKIETDGRYYRIIRKEKSIVLDLGYDFIARNKQQLLARL